MKLPSRIARGTFDLYVYEFGQRGRYVVLDRKMAEENRNPLVRVESNCVWAHVFGSARCDCAAQTHEAMRRVIEEDRGLIIHAYDQDGRGISLPDHVRVYMGQDRGLDTVDADSELGYSHYDRREYNDIVTIMKDYQLGNIRLLTNNPDRIRQLEHAFTIQREPLESASLDRWNAAQLFAKKAKMNHMFSFDENDASVMELAAYSRNEGCKSEYTED